MLAAAVVMMRNKIAKRAAQATAETKEGNGVDSELPQARWIIGVEGAMVGIVTGLVGVGGGFLIVPALVIFGKLPLRVAIGTSLAVIAMNSLSGFFKYLDVLHLIGATVDWYTVATQRDNYHYPSSNAPTILVAGMPHNTPPRGDRRWRHRRHHGRRAALQRMVQLPGRGDRRSVRQAL